MATHFFIVRIFWQREQLAAGGLCRIGKKQLRKKEKQVGPSRSGRTENRVFGSQWRM